MKKITHSECALLRLPNESLSEILMACDPEDALRMAQTCKILHLVSDSKRLWLTLLAKLDYDQAPDVGLHVDLDSLQAKEVKKIVIRALTSYNNWCSPDGPRATRKQKVQLESHQLVALDVLPGCQYLIVQSRNSDYLGVWDINREMLVVRYQCSRKLHHRTCNCALLKGGKIARFAFLYNENRDRIDVVDFDLRRGHATLLFSGPVKNERPIYSLKVRGEVVLVKSYYNTGLLRLETGEIALLNVRSIRFDFDVVRGFVIGVFTAVDGTVRLLLAKLSRIFEHFQDTEPIPLLDICEICRVLTFIPRPDDKDRAYTLTVCDPLAWGSARPCRILLAHIAFSNDQKNIMARVHRLYLDVIHNGSDLVLTYDSSSNYVPLEASLFLLPGITCPSIAGCWMLLVGDLKGKYDIKLHRLWEDNVRLSPSDVVSYVWAKAERFSGTQIWYLKDGNCILHFFD